MEDRILEIKKLFITDWFKVKIKNDYELKCSLRDADYVEKGSGDWYHSKIHSLPSFKKEMFQYENSIIEVKHFNSLTIFIDTNGNTWDIRWIER